MKLHGMGSNRHGGMAHNNNTYNEMFATVNKGFSNYISKLDR